jgi:hypothetical protein
MVNTGAWIRILRADDVPLELVGKVGIVQQIITVGGARTLFTYVFGYGTKMLFENQVEEIENQGIMKEPQFSKPWRGGK